MDESTTDDHARAASEAADWFARLGARSVTNRDLSDFDAWRQDPTNRAAYEKVEKVWRTAERLSGDPQIEAAAEAASQRREPAPSKPVSALRLPPARVIWTGLGGLALAVALTSQPLWRGAAYVTGTGEQRVVQLADGSQVRLDTQTQLRVRFSAQTRRIELERGQAFFSVAHDTTRPFVVEAGDTQVRAIGTRFDVRRDRNQVRVVLVQGVVEVRKDGLSQAPPVRLQAGEELASGSKGPVKRAADIEAATSWTQGRIVFRSVPLSQAVAEVNRYSDRKLELEPGPIASAQVSGVFDAGDTEAFLAAVKDLHGLTPQRQWNGTLRLQGPQPG